MCYVFLYDKLLNDPVAWVNNELAKVRAANENA